MRTNPRFPVYIVSKGRHDTRLTAKSLDAIGVPFRIIVEEQERSLYAEVIDESKILVLPKSFQDEYDTCDKLGSSKSKGPGAARNFAWSHSIALDAHWHWVMDDNIKGFYRLHRNRKVPVVDGTIFFAMEEFCLRYSNLVMAGPSYTFLTKRKQKLNPVIFNTRIYSCNLIRNDLPYRWRGRYNEDTDLSLRILKAGLCTVQFNAFLQDKVGTQTVKGGCDRDFYSVEGTLPKSNMLLALHPGCTRVKWKFSRWHHQVDYRRFKKNKLIRRPEAAIANEPNEFGMVLVHHGQN